MRDQGERALAIMCDNRSLKLENPMARLLRTPEGISMAPKRPAAHPTGKLARHWQHRSKSGRC
eukprot:scaffold19235_cov126-Isochrysis_galbana.AAC.26